MLKRYSNPIFLPVQNSVPKKNKFSYSVDHLAATKNSRSSDKSLDVTMQMKTPFTYLNETFLGIKAARKKSEIVNPKK